MPLTITEGLAEIKTLIKRAEKKRESIRTYLVRQEQFKDPLVKEGGSASFVQQERQSLKDLEVRVVHVRKAIRVANEINTLMIDGEVRSISDWLTWRREVSPNQVSFLQDLRNRIVQVRQQAASKGLQVVTDEGQAKSNDVIVNLSEKDLSADIEHIEKVLGELDGQLSMKNATTPILIEE